MVHLAGVHGPLLGLHLALRVTEVRVTALQYAAGVPDHQDSQGDNHRRGIERIAVRLRVGKGVLVRVNTAGELRDTVANTHLKIYLLV